MDISRGLLLHTNTIIRNSHISNNVVSGYKKYVFDNNTFNHSLSLFNNNATKLNPECIIFRLHENSDITLNELKYYIDKMIIYFEIGPMQLLKIPLQLLWNLKTPEIINNKLYLTLPFHLFFNDIHICGLRNQNVKFRIEYNTANNYILDYSLLCKIYLVNSTEERCFIDTSNNIVQQVSSIHVKVDQNNPNTKSNEFRIRTNTFCGLVKGFFLEATQIYELLEELQFYINDCIRIDFDKYMIQNMCIKINENMIYIPFNSEVTYNSRVWRSYNGSLNIDNFGNSFLNLKFSSPIQNVCVYALNMNIYTQRNSVCYLDYNYDLQHVKQDFSIHSLIPIEELLENQHILNLRYLNRPIVDISFNYISQTLHRVIENDRNICPITHNIIQLCERYMLCVDCLSCYNEYAIIEWFQSLNNSRRPKTCPTCREIWSNYNVYINSL